MKKNRARRIAVGLSLAALACLTPADRFSVRPPA